MARRTGRTDVERQALEQAVSVAEAKGHVLGADRARAGLAALGG